MKLNEYLNLCEDGLELTVYDKVYDVEVYFYKGNYTDPWQKTMMELATLLRITSIKPTGVVVNLSDVLRKHTKLLVAEGLFNSPCDLDDIMYNIKSILAGNVSQKWLDTFVSILKRS